MHLIIFRNLVFQGNQHIKWAFYISSLWILHRDETPWEQWGDTGAYREETWGNLVEPWLRVNFWSWFASGKFFFSSFRRRKISSNIGHILAFFSINIDLSWSVTLTYIFSKSTIFWFACLVSFLDHFKLRYYPNIQFSEFISQILFFQLL